MPALAILDSRGLPRAEVGEVLPANKNRAKYSQGRKVRLFALRSAYVDACPAMGLGAAARSR